MWQRFSIVLFYRTSVEDWASWSVVLGLVPVNWYQFKLFYRNIKNNCIQAFYGNKSFRQIKIDEIDIIGRSRSTNTCLVPEAFLILSKKASVPSNSPYKQYCACALCAMFSIYLVAFLSEREFVQVEICCTTYSSKCVNYSCWRPFSVSATFSEQKVTHHTVCTISFCTFHENLRAQKKESRKYQQCTPCDAA